jgi:tRNA A-37 threonylcarbamoyl transferase component Bud32
MPPIVSRDTVTEAAPGRLFEPPGWDWAQVGDVGWWVRPDWRPALLGPQGLRLEEWERLGRLSTVKTGPHRVVYRADLPEGTVYVKHFLVPGWREKLRQWFRRGKGRNEGRRAAHLAAIGVPTITPIALGEQRKKRFLFENYLITPAIPETMPLDEFVEGRLPLMEGPRQARIRQRLSVAMAELTARIHNAGLVHGDFHPGNLLVQLDEDDRPHLAMIDLDALRVRRRLGWGDVRDNLALLNHYFWLRCGRADRQRFLLAYLRARGSSPPDPHAFAREIEASTREWAERLWRRWGRRCLGKNKYFETYGAHRSWAVASRDLDGTTVEALLADPDAPFSQPDAVILKDSRTTTVADLTLTVLGQPTRVIYKRFNRKKWFDPIYVVFRPSRAWRAWQAGQHLLSRAVPTPRNLAVIGRAYNPSHPLRPWLTPLDTYLVTIKAEPSITLCDYLLRELPGLEPDRRRVVRHQLIVALARLIRTLHERSLSHRDLKSANILVEGDPTAPDVHLSLIDLVGVQLSHPLPEHRRLQNLARLLVSLSEAPGLSRTDALRFLHAYVPWAFSDRDRWKAVWRAVEQRGHKKTEQNRRRGRVLS